MKCRGAIIYYNYVQAISPDYKEIFLLIAASLIAQLVKNTPAMLETRFDSWVRKIHWRREKLPTPVFLDFPCGSGGQISACSSGDLGLIPVLGRFPGEGIVYPLQYSWASVLAQMVKNPPAIWETWV